MLPWLFVYLGLHLVQRVRTTARDAIITLLLMLAAAGFVWFLNWLPTPDQELRRIAFGDLPVLGPREVAIAFAAFVGLGLVNYWQRKPLLLVSFDRARAAERGLNIAWWDLLFYFTLALILALCAATAGLLVLVAYVVVPALIAMMLTRAIALRLLLGWLVAVIGGIAGFCISVYRNIPSGVAIVCTLIAMLVIVATARLFRRRNSERLAG